MDLSLGDFPVTFVKLHTYHLNLSGVVGIARRADNDDQAALASKRANCYERKTKHRAFIFRSS